MKKTLAELIDYMWEVYPLDNQIAEREAMLKSFDFLSGKIDKEKQERSEILKQIQQKHKK